MADEVKDGATPEPAPVKEVYTREEVDRMKANWGETVARHEAKAKKAEEKAAAMLAEAEKKRVEDERAKMDVVERQKAEIADRDKRIASMEAGIVAERIDNAIKWAGKDEGVIDVGDLLAMIDRGAIKVTDSGVEGVAEAVKKLKESKPYLFQGGQPAGQGLPAPRRDGGNPGRPPTTQEIAQEMLNRRRAAMAGPGAVKQ